jgi:uncharacterized protein (TIGR04255 family)
MAKPREHLRRAPIVEALIDVRVIPREGITPEEFQRLGESLKAVYPTGSPIQSIEARIGVDRGTVLPPQQVATNVGWLVQTAERTAVAQFRLDGFTFNKLEPYTRWEEVFEEADRLWRSYVEISRPVEVTRMAVRYINRLRLPSSTELREFLEAPPVLPLPIPQTVREFLTRVVVYDAARDASAIITQALESALDPTFLPVLLDIDAFREAPVAPDDASMPQIFEQLRRLKNEVFFASITEKTVEMYA